MSGGFLVYKCRQCGAIDDAMHVPDTRIALVHLTTGLKLPPSWGPLASSTMLVDVCNCGDGNYGVSDLIGTKNDPSPGGER